MDIITLTSLLGIIGLLSERLFKVIRKSRCNHIACKCCGSELDIDRVIEGCNEIEQKNI